MSVRRSARNHSDVTKLKERWGMDRRGSVHVRRLGTRQGGLQSKSSVSEGQIDRIYLELCDVRPHASALRIVET